MADTSIHDDDRADSPEAAEEQVYPAEPVTPEDADEADVLEQAREEPLDEEPRE